MTRFSLAYLVAAGAIAGQAACTSPAAAAEYPWCAQYSGQDGDGGKNCGFVSWEQCMQTVRGIGGDCVRNLFYDDRTERPAKRARKSRDD
ncbi:MAG TPA: DUF3551 domain-containing protein [Pseudolabrys sp.]